jgi:hypothetical protein
MKKFLLAVILVALIGFGNKSEAQCSGANVLITNISVNTTATHYVYSFVWSYLSGNASIQIRFRCGPSVNANYTFEGRCLPWLKDSVLGPHLIKDSIAIADVPVCNSPEKTLVIGIWTNNNCGGNFCEAQGGEISLPVKFANFNANRNKSNVNINWVTASEFNNSGFAVERNINSSWEQIAWVPSLAVNGNSDGKLSYSFVDQNNIKGISQYRVRQVDLDGKVSFSEIKSVRGENQSIKLTVYPNPSSNGKVNIVFDEEIAVRNVTVMDLSGRVVTQMNGVTNNNITIDNLKPGMYTVRVVVPQTGAQAVEKIIVNGR